MYKIYNVYYNLLTNKSKYKDNTKINNNYYKYYKVFTPLVTPYNLIVWLIRKQFI